MPGSRKSHSRVWVHHAGQHRFAEMSRADRLATTGWWVNWRQVQPGLVTQKLSFHWGVVVECHGMVISMLQVGKWMLILDREISIFLVAVGAATVADAGTVTSTAMGARYCECWGPVWCTGRRWIWLMGSVSFRVHWWGWAVSVAGRLSRPADPQWVCVIWGKWLPLHAVQEEPSQTCILQGGGGVCACAGVLLIGGSPHRAHPAVGHHRLGHRDNVDTGVRWNHKCSLVRKESGLASYSSSARRHGTLGGAS